MQGDYAMGMREGVELAKAIGLQTDGLKEYHIHVTVEDAVIVEATYYVTLDLDSMGTFSVEEIPNEETKIYKLKIDRSVDAT